MLIYYGGERGHALTLLTHISSSITQNPRFQWPSMIFCRATTLQVCWSGADITKILWSACWNSIPLILLLVIIPTNTVAMVKSGQFHRLNCFLEQYVNKVVRIFGYTGPRSWELAIIGGVWGKKNSPCKNHTFCLHHPESLYSDVSASSLALYPFKKIKLTTLRLVGFCSDITRVFWCEFRHLSSYHPASRSLAS